MIGLLVTLCLGPGPSIPVHHLDPNGSVHPPALTHGYVLPTLVPPLRPTRADDPGAAFPATPAPAPTLPDDQILAATASGHRSASTITLAAGDRTIPARVLEAYRKAATRTAQDAPGCHLPWQLLAGIGKVESGHAAGRPITEDGTITRPILGPALDGKDGLALIRDTDHGIFDQDTTYDRAVGPMQFIPTTWRIAGRDNSGDHRADPHNIDDATLAAAGYLCAHHRDLTKPTQLRAAIYSYNPSNSYVHAVLAWAAGYTTTGATPTLASTGVSPDPAVVPPPAVVPSQSADLPPTGSSPTPLPTGSVAPAPPVAGGTPVPTPSPAPTTAGPSPRPSTSPSPGTATSTAGTSAPSPVRPSPAPPPATPSARTSPATPSPPGDSAGDLDEVPTVAPSSSLLVIPLTPKDTPASTAAGLIP